uniref:SHSP domain-containing protein n=1 Tax=Anabas testudineus TaxID=64144 RepID=A0A7N6A4Z7_ANATE
MSQHAALSSLFADDPFFSQERLLWPLHHKALSSLQQDFFNSRAKLTDLLSSRAAEESQSCSCSSSSSSSSSSCTAFSSTASSQMGFIQKINLPDHLDLSGLSHSLMDDGQLRIHTPVVKQPISDEYEVPIRFRTSLEFPITKDETEDADMAKQ